MQYGSVPTKRCVTPRAGAVLAEDFQVYFGVAVVNNALLFDEVARERGAGNDVFRTAMHG